MLQAVREQLMALADHFAREKEAILRALQAAAKADPELSTARSLTRGQFRDHIPQILDTFEKKLRENGESGNPQKFDTEQKDEEKKHGLHRWQQGYRLLELTHEWGHFQLCLFDEVEKFARENEACTREGLVEATRQIILLVNEAIRESVGQYERLQRAEAAGRLGDLEKALAGLREIESRRSTLIHQAVHDLRGNVQSVRSAAQIMAEGDLKEAERVEFSTLLQGGVQAVSVMLGELMELSRLEAGQERRKIASFDAAAMATELCNVNRAVAQERGLSLKVSGPASFPVMGDSTKVRRLLQNLVLNALKYTTVGGVAVSWGEEKANWYLMVTDTGPGMMGGPGAPMLDGLKEATVSARESDEKTAADEGDSSHVLKAPPGAKRVVPPHQQPGEGIGLSIVKRLCELLDASLEMASEADKGTIFRVVFPRNYSELDKSAALRAAGAL